MEPVSAERGQGFSPLESARVGWIYALLLAGALAVLVAAEWPRLSARLGMDEREPRSRPGRRRRNAPHLTVVPDEEAEEFAAAIERDLEQLPTIDERNGR